jgi:hypothetical protein
MPAEGRSPVCAQLRENLPLTGAQKTKLRGLSQTLEASLKIGRAGLAPTSQPEFVRLLDAREFEKIRFAGTDRHARRRPQQGRPARRPRSRPRRNRAPRPRRARRVTSSHTRRGLKLLGGHAAPGRTLAFVGSSGVGKSSLVTRLARDAELATGEVREKDAKGPPHHHAPRTRPCAERRPHHRHPRHARAPALGRGRSRRGGSLRRHRRHLHALPLHQLSPRGRA